MERLTSATITPDITLVTDGGSLGNPGKGYGSYRIEDRDGFSEIVRLEFPGIVTNNQAEYQTLNSALEAARLHAANRGWELDRTCVRLRTDSQLLVNQVLGRWKVKNEGLRPLNAAALDLVRRFGSTDIGWWPRARTVAILGH